MVKVLENRAVDLDIAPGVKDGGDLKNQADALTYGGPRTPPPPLLHPVVLFYKDR